MNIFSKEAVIDSLFLIVVLVLSYFPVILTQQMVNPDSSVILFMFEHIKNMGQYWSMLLSLETIDVQPLRDLSLYLDFIIFQKWQINISVLQNLIFWFLSCNVIKKILQNNFSNLKRCTLRLIILAFAVYPIFSTSIVWGIARKHLMSFYFISLATYNVMKVSSGNTKDAYLSLLFYFLSLLCQPINILWPFWAITYSWMYKRLVDFKILIYGLVLFFAAAITNWYYYSRSNVFKQYYNSKTQEIANLPDKILAFGHYISHIIFPYRLTYQYSLGDWMQILGIVIGVISLVIFYKSKNDKKDTSLWLLFSALPLLVITNTPNLLSDTYLLSPGLGLLVLLVGYFQNLKVPKKLLKIAAPLVLLIWMGANYFYSKTWTSLESFTSNAFHANQSCDTALTSARIGYEFQGSIGSDEKNFLEKHECMATGPMPQDSLRNLIKLNSLIVYYEQDLPLETRIKALENYSSREVYPRLLLAALYAQNNMAEKVIETMKNLNPESFLPRNTKDYDLIVSKTLYPYCLKMNLSHCLKVTVNMKDEVLRPWL